MARLNKKAIKVLQGKNFAFLATLNPDGSPQVTPVWADTDGKNLLVNTAAGRVKERNMARDPRVAVSIIDMKNPYYMVSVDGVVRASLKGKKADDHIDSLSFRFTGQKKYQGRRTPDEQRVIFVIEPTKVREQ